MRRKARSFCNQTVETLSGIKPQRASTFYANSIGTADPADRIVTIVSRNLGRVIDRSGAYLIPRLLSKTMTGVFEERIAQASLTGFPALPLG